MSLAVIAVAPITPEPPGHEDTSITHSHGRVANAPQHQANCLPPVCLSVRLPVCLLCCFPVCLPVSLFACLCMLSLFLSRECVISAGIQKIYKYLCTLSAVVLHLSNSAAAAAAALKCNPRKSSFSSALAEPIKIYGQVIFKADTCRQHKNVTSSARLGLSLPCPSLACLALPHHALLSFALFRFLFYSTPASCQPEPALQMFVLLCSFPLYLSLRFPHCSIFVYFADEAKGAVENAMKLSIRRSRRGGRGRRGGCRRKCA